MKCRLVILLFSFLLLAGCTAVSNENSGDVNSIENSDLLNKTDTEYEKLLSQYHEILFKYNDTNSEQFYSLDYEAMEKFQALLKYRESVCEMNPLGYEVYYEVPGTMIRFSEIYKNNDEDFRYVTYIPGYNNSRVFLQIWNDDVFESTKLLTVLLSPEEENAVVDTRILTDESGVYANILIKKSNWDISDESYEMYTYKIENRTLTSFIPIKGIVSAGNWMVEETEAFDTDSLAIEIKCNKEKETSVWFNVEYKFEGNVLVISEIGNPENSIQLIFENGEWK
ncbi:hypothetical protein IZU99_08015 [Oscillospiraceae bacterium CM]|nr:hypothetical protein IZU99_08015 [Oscillospiraceae bacterium CM]